MFLTLCLLCLSQCEEGFSIIAKHCFSFEENLLDDLDNFISCEYHAGLGPYAECNISDFRTDLREVRPEVKSLCIFHNARLIPEKAFSNLESLEFLSIYGGQLNEVQSDAFFGLYNLKYLKIIFDAFYKCRNVSLGTQAFAGLANLKELELTGFQFKNIAHSKLDPFTGLESLMLARVCVEELSEVFCHLDNMFQLQHLSLMDSGVLTVSNQSCMAKSAVLPGVKILNLKGNSIQTIQADSLKVFQNLSSLFLEFHGESISSLWKSGIGTVSNVHISGNVSKMLFTDFEDLCHMTVRLSVSTLELDHIKAELLSEKSLQKCGMLLRMLNMSSSRIQEINFGFWKNAALIKSLAMVNMDLKEASFCSTDNGTWNITSLNLEKNSLTEIKSNQFACMPLLEQLLLSNNVIETLLQGALNGLKSLRILKLDSNKIKQLAYSDFESLLALEVLLLVNNDIHKIEEGTFRNQQQLQEITLGTLMFSELYLSLIFYGFPPKIRKLSIDTGPLMSFMHFGVISPLERPFALNLNIYSIFIDDCNNAALRSVQELKLKVELTFYCKSRSFWSYPTNIESFEYSGDAEKEYERYMDINTLHHLKYLKLINLNLSNHTDPGMIFWNLKKLQILVLLNCRLNFLTKSMFRDLQSLVLLRMYVTTPLLLVDGMFDVVPSLTVVVLDRLDFQCDCKNGWFLDWAETSRQVQVVHLQNQQCIWHYNSRNYLETMEKLCQTDVQYLCYLVTSITITLLALVSVTTHFYYWPCVVLFFRLRGHLERKLGRKWTRRRQRDSQEEEEVKYDAFVSFSSHDEAWVFGELASRLEEQDQPRLRLCLHQRDFEVSFIHRRVS